MFCSFLFPFCFCQSHTLRSFLKNEPSKKRRSIVTSKLLEPWTIYLSFYLFVIPRWESIGCYQDSDATAKGERAPDYFSKKRFFSQRSIHIFPIDPHYFNQNTAIQNPHLQYIILKNPKRRSVCLTVDIGQNHLLKIKEDQVQGAAE